MPENWFFCGLSSEQEDAYAEAGQRLTLNGEDANVELHIDDIRTRYRRDLPGELIDLLEIAAYVFAADNATSRGGPKREHMAAQWRREFRLVVAVRKLDIWSRPDVTRALQEALNFISDDTWHLEFVLNMQPATQDSYLKLRPANDDDAFSKNVLLFSGGLDSLAGAVRELVEDLGSIVLVSHRAAPITMNRQDRLVVDLKKRFGGRVFHVPVRVRMKRGLRTREYSQRTRSFLFTSLATVVALLEKATNIRFYENGVMSVNLPPAAHYVGSRASRTTHPNSLRLLQDAMYKVTNAHFRIDNPYIWMTKGEVIRELVHHRAGKLIPHTISCTRTRKIDAMHSHCGECAQCMHRRFAVLSEELHAEDPAESYATDLLEGKRRDLVKRAMSIDVVRSALEMSRATDLEFLDAYGGHIGLLSSTFPGMTEEDVMRRVIDLFHRFGDEIYSVLSSNTKSDVQQISGDGGRNLLDAVGDVKSKTDVTPKLDTRLQERAQAPPQAGVAAEAPDSGVILIINEKRSELDIDGLALEENGPRIYAIVSRLAEQRDKDIAEGIFPRDFPTINLGELVKNMNLESDGPLRSAISRFLKKVEDTHADLNAGLPAIPPLIENVRGKGYRIHPFVQIHRIKKSSEIISTT